jgi:hypothetical protein
LDSTGLVVVTIHVSRTVYFFAMFVAMIAIHTAKSRHARPDDSRIRTATHGCEAGVLSTDYADCTDSDSHPEDTKTPRFQTRKWLTTDRHGFTQMAETPGVEHDRENGDCTARPRAPRDCPRFRAYSYPKPAGCLNLDLYLNLNLNLAAKPRTVPASRPMGPPLFSRNLIPSLSEGLHWLSQLTLEVTAQTTAETRPQTKPREALQEACQVPSGETSPMALLLDFQVTMELASQTANRDAVDFAVRFAAQVASRTTVRTTPGTVPGTVPTVVPRGSILARSTATNASLRCNLAGL